MSSVLLRLFARELGSIRDMRMWVDTRKLFVCPGLFVTLALYNTTSLCHCVSVSLCHCVSV